MHRLLLCLILISSCFADFDSPLSDEGDPAIVHHVNVITGHLHLSFQDVVADGIVPIPLMRSYSSTGALEDPRNQFFLQAARGGWMLQGGWELLSHTNLLLVLGEERTKHQVYLAEPGGGMIRYKYKDHKAGDKYTIILRPKRIARASSGMLSTRTNSDHNLLQVNLQTGDATLFLPDGGFRVYKGSAIPKHLDPQDVFSRHFFLLQREVFPNGQQMIYSYDFGRNLQKIEARNPDSSKIYSSISFDWAGGRKKPFRLNAKTSDQKHIHYQTKRHDHLDYLESVETSFCAPEKTRFACGRKGTLPHLVSLDLAGHQQLEVQYHRPSNLEREKKWEEHPETKRCYADKVYTLFGNIGPGGNPQTLATFGYKQNVTYVRDADQILTEYHHDGTSLSHIRYCDQNDQYQLIQRFGWYDGHLTSKTMCDAQDTPLYSKGFVYDGDNVIEEILSGDLTGEQIPPVQTTYRKTFSYYKENWNLLHTSSEEEGPTYEYQYKPCTDLLSAKFTKDHAGRILIREFFTYDSDNLLVEEIIDNGVSPNPDDLTHVTQRQHKRIERNSQTSLPETITELYWDALSNRHHLLKKTKLTHSNQKIVEEAVYDANDTYRYTIYTQYDPAGHVLRKTTPLGQENTYRYNALGLLEWSKEVGSAAITYQYDAAHRLVSSFNHETCKTITAAYTSKDKVHCQTDEQGRTTRYDYDRLGNRTSALFPPIQDQHGQPQQPTATFGYNVHGDLTSSTTPLQGTTHTHYNLFHKPTQIIQADGTVIRHIYYKNGALAKTRHPDGTQECYQYDLFQRMIRKTVHAPSGGLLSQESWEYNAFQLIAYTDPTGLTHRTHYDGAGRKISEETADRKTTYTYDALGFLERTTHHDTAIVQKHNVAGLIEEQWQESAGHIENRMQFLYNAELQKIQATRWTPEGEAIDRFEYHDHKLVKHIDPKGATTHFFYNEDHLNELGQKVLRKTTIDPLNHGTIETYDAAGRLVTHENTDPSGRIVAREEFLYDLAGNQAKRITHVYLENTLQKTLTVSRVYDIMGRLIEEIEPTGKRTTFTYNNRGLLTSRTLPDGIQIFFHYDALGRLLLKYTSDSQIYDEYRYALGSKPTHIIDHVRGISLERTYNLFGELIQERNSHGHTMHWTYDTAGRSLTTTLPDNSSIHYSYLGAHLHTIQRLDPSGTPLYQHTYDRFDINGHVSHETLINQLGTLQTTHDLLERPTEQTSAWLIHSSAYGPSSLVIHTQNSLFGSKTYAYDPLDQLIQEGDTTYHFDSVGNPTAHPVNDLNQLLSTDTQTLSYHPNGHLQQKTQGDQNTLYTFDPYGRLTHIQTSDTKIHYLYDPLSRLYAKETYLLLNTTWQLQQTLHYLHDRDYEIGTLTPSGTLLQLKILGLGLQGDIGAAVALELDNHTYAPLHDFNGNILALVDSTGHLAESYSIDAFGREQTSSPPKNPWRFSSKRTDEQLIFFGLRCYDASLGRWISPDPAGFADGPNLYAYVHNSPPNRLDLFGLFGDGKFDSDPFPPIAIHIPIRDLPQNNALIHCKVLEQGIPTDYFVSCGHWHKLQFTPEELSSGVFNLLEHKEVMPQAGQINLVTYTHGMNTELKDFRPTIESMIDQIPGTLFIGRFYGTKGVCSDGRNAIKEMHGVETLEVCKNRQFLLTCSAALEKLNPAVYDASGARKAYGALWLHFDHSRGGALDTRALESITYEQKQTLQTQLLMTCIAPATPVPKEYGLDVVNYYSKADHITGRGGKAVTNPQIPYFVYVLGDKFSEEYIAKNYPNPKDYNIRYVRCKSKRSERTGWVADHAILGRTYQEVISTTFRDYKKLYGIYENKNR